MAVKIKDKSGQRYGRLIVLRFFERRGKDTFWTCLCDCGNTSEVPGSNLGRTTNSCGCLRKELQSKAAKRHGMDGTKEYRAWIAMKGRCTSPRYKSFPDYGGRGVKVCERWLNSFENFYQDMGPCKVGDSLERKDSNGGYEPDNCIWIPKRSQSRNRRGVSLIEFQSELLTMAEIAAKIHVHRNTIAYHLEKGKTVSWISDRFSSRAA